MRHYGDLYKNFSANAVCLGIGAPMPCNAEKWGGWVFPTDYLHQTYSVVAQSKRYSHNCGLFYTGTQFSSISDEALTEEGEETGCTIAYTQEKE